MNKNAPKNSGHRFAMVILTLMSAGLLAGVLLPFFFESQSLYYKFGMEKAMLQWGKAAGFMAVILMVVQVVLVSRFSFLGTSFSLARLFSLHKYTGVLICLLAMVHPFLILGADGFVFFPLELRYWSEFTGVFLAVSILIVAGLSLWRRALKLPVRSWLRLHRLATPAIVALTLVHARTVSETFDHVLPGIWLGIIAIIALVLFTRIYFKRFSGK